MPTPSKIHAVENIIRSQLRSLGYHTIQIEKAKIDEKSFAVVAEGTLRDIYLRVLVKMVSERSRDLSEKEITKIRQEAESISKEPWTAILSVNDKGELMDKIRWRNLSPQYA